MIGLPLRLSSLCFLLASTLLLVPSTWAWVAVPAGITTRGQKVSSVSSLAKRTSFSVATAPSSSSTTRLYQTNSSLASSEGGDEDETSNDDSSNLKQQRQTATEVLDQIIALKNVVLEDYDSASSAAAAATGSTSDTLKDYQQQVDELEAKVVEMESDLIPPVGMTMEEYQSTMVLFLKLPFVVRCAFVEALVQSGGLILEDQEDPAKLASDLSRISEIVTLLYQQRVQLTPQRLQDGIRTAQQRIKMSSSAKSTTIGTMSVTIVENDDTATTATTSTNDKENGNNNNSKNSFPKTGNDLLRLFDDSDDSETKTDEELQRDNTIKNVLGRVTRKKGIAATKSDLDRLLKVLDKETFVVAGTEEIPGGYVIRGKRNTANVKTGADLIRVIDEKLPPPEDYPATVSLMGDITSTDVAAEALMDDEEKSQPVLVLLNKDFTQEVSGIVTALSTTIALTAAFVFCVSVYGQNDLVAARLSDATAVNDADGVTWFTDKVYDVLVPILGLQLLHEVGHFVTAKAYKFDMGFPTAIPFFGLPFMGTKTDLTSSPPNRNALFDFAIMGPLLGLLASFACFAYGLELTATADAASTQYFPALPVDLINKSTLGGSMIDYFLGGGMVGYDNRFVTMQEPNTPVTLHPLAIAGFTSIIMNALALLPLGSTDGGRLSQALFGRFGHITISSFVWIALLITTFTAQRSDIIIVAWAINNFIQNDCEIPCRDETEDVSFPRVMAALTLWFVTVLAITPL